MDLIQIQTPEYLKGYAESRIGGRLENQDSFGYSDTPFGFLITVCDGMGGGPGGKTASSIAVKEIIQGVIDGNNEEELTNILIKAIRRANLAIISKGSEIPELKGMGSTCAVLLINKEYAIIAHVGDSRVYQLRGKAKVFRTFDHSMVFGLVKQKVITEEQARLSAQSNVITRALGIKADAEVDVTIRPYLSEDRFILCTDGIHGSLPENELISLTSDRKHSLGAVTDSIATTVDGKGNTEGGGHDNLTLVIIEPSINSKSKDKMSNKIKMLLSLLMLLCVFSIIGNIFMFTNINALKNSSLMVNDSILNDSLIAELKDSVSSKSSRIESQIKKISSLETDLKKCKNEIKCLKSKANNANKPSK